MISRVSASTTLLKYFAGRTPFDLPEHRICCSLVLKNLMPSAIAALTLMKM